MLVYLPEVIESQQSWVEDSVSEPWELDRPSRLGQIYIVVGQAWKPSKWKRNVEVGFGVICV